MKTIACKTTQAILEIIINKHWKRHLWPMKLQKFTFVICGAYHGYVLIGWRAVSVCHDIVEGTLIF